MHILFLKKLAGLFLFVLLSVQLFAQDKRVIQFTGIIMTSDSLMAIPNVFIYEKTSGRGTLSNFKGFFSFAAETGDTIMFSSIGFKKQRYIIPKDLTDERYSIIQLMPIDTIFLAETIIYPWPSKEEFKDAFLTADIPDDDYELARKNLENEMLKEMGLALANDGDMNADYQTKQLAQKIYYAGQNAPITVLNIFNWIEFFEAWKRGDFKKKDKN
ncbi:MAG: carboxypeptidase-like regulatory domain-containing protein [Fimbriimonadaceae bacterium]|nr:carboxypeptidase-like regulatory domain-containing protein [Chitinophagales bacterium]